MDSHQEQAEIALLRSQKRFLLTEAKKSLLLAGIGYGKSFCGALFVLCMLDKYPKAKGLITANTYTQLTNATVTALIGVFEQYNIPHKVVLGGARKHIQVFDTIIYLYSLERPDSIRGIEVGWWWSDESAFSKIEAVQVCRGRLRDKNGPLFERHTSSPNGYNWMYDEFENMDGKLATPRIELIRGITKDNIFLPDGYYDSLLEDYGGPDNPLAQQELFGQFTNLQEGAIYWAFDRNRHVGPCQLDEKYPVYVGQDFNVDNMEGCYVQYIDGHFRICSENILNYHNANTDSAASKICQDLKPKYNVMVVPDSTGKARKSSDSGRTDIEILQSYGLTVMTTKNPFIRDRQNTLNMHMKKGKVTIDPTCKKLIKELETINSRDKEGEKAHVSVSLGYVTWKLAPLLTRKEAKTYRYA